MRLVPTALLLTLCATPLWAQSPPGPQTGPFTSPQQEPYGGTGPVRAAPDSKQAAPAREQEEDRLAAEVEAWGKRLEQLAGKGEGDEVRELRRRHDTLVVQYQKMIQTDGPAWETARQHYDQALDRLTTAFERAGGNVAEAR